MANLVFNSGAAYTTYGYGYLDDNFTRVFRYPATGKLFIPFGRTNGADCEPVFWESTDSGATWSKAGTAGPTFDDRRAGVYQRGQYIYFAYFDASTTQLGITRYDLAASTFSSVATGGPSYAAPTVSMGFWHPELIVRDDDSVVVQIVSSGHAGYAIWDGASWTSGGLDTGNNSAPYHLYLTDDGVTHMLTQRKITTSFYLMHVPIDAANTVGSLAQIADSFNAYGNTGSKIPAPIVTDGGTVYFTSERQPKAGTAFIPMTVFAGDSGTAPTWTVTTTDLYSGDEVGGGNWYEAYPIAYKESGLVWREPGASSTLDFYFQQEDIASGQEFLWTKPNLLWAGTPADNLIQAHPFNSGGWAGSPRTVYSGTGTVEIYWLDAATLATSGTVYACRHYANQ